MQVGNVRPRPVKGFSLMTAFFTRLRKVHCFLHPNLNLCKFVTVNVFHNQELLFDSDIWEVFLRLGQHLFFNYYSAF